jgi:hypothetical protein
VATLLVREDRAPTGPSLPTPDSPWRDLSLGWSAAHVHEYAEAEGHFQRALSRMPSLRPACEWKAHAQFKLGRQTEAEATLKHCQQMFPDAERHKQLLNFLRSKEATPG